MYEEQKNISIALFIPLFLIALLLGTGLGYYYAKSNIKEKACPPCPQLTEQTTTDTLTETETPKSTFDTSTWQIYDNPKYGYVFRYPKSWDMIDYLYDTLTKSKRDQYKFVVIDDKEIPTNALGYATEMPTPTLGFFVIDEMPNNFGTDGFVESTMEIDGVMARKIIYTEPSMLDGMYSTNIYFEKDGQAYTIIHKNTDALGTHAPVIDEIIKTFKFK